MPFNRLAVMSPNQAANTLAQKRQFTPPPQINPQVMNPQMQQGFKMPPDPPIQSAPILQPQINPQTSILPPKPITPQIGSVQTQPINPSPMNPPQNVPSNPQINPGQIGMRPKLRAPIGAVKRNPFPTY